MAELTYDYYRKEYQDKVIDLWNNEVGFIYPITKEMFNQNITNSRYLFDKASILCFDGQKLVGFILCKIYDNNPIIEKYTNFAFISLIYVARDYRKKGIGNYILAKAEEELKKKDITRINVGSDIDNFFPGIPNDFDNLTDVFFKKHGYTVSYYTHDLICKIKKQNYITQKMVTEKLISEKDNFEIRYATKNDEEKVLAFFKKCFYGRWYFEAKEYFDENEIKEEYLIVIDKEKQKVIGFLRTNKGLIKKISYNIMWKERFDRLLGLGPLGVDSEYRKQKIGSLLLNYGMLEAYEDNFSDVLIDWTGLVAFYQRLGFETWKCYQYAYKNI